MHDTFKWDSEEQRKGFLSALQWIRAKGFTAATAVTPIDLYLIQKQHEAHEYWREVFVTQFGILRDEIKLLQTEIAQLKRAQP